MDIGYLNSHRAHLLIHTLLELGVDSFFIAPGSRSTPLMLAIHALSKGRYFVHFDERGLGFQALGYAKAKRKPVAILVTSGTAVANLLPSVVEAHLSRIPLILLTADRPPELRDCGANQSINQVNIFSSFVKGAVDLALQDPLASDDYLSSHATHLLNRAITPPMGPVHLNCQIREPLFSSHFTKGTFSSPCHYELSQTLPSEDSFLAWARELSAIEKGVILLGSDAIEQPSPIVELASTLGWPIFSDVLSGGRMIGNHPVHIEHFDLLLKTFPEIQVDAILHIGDRFVSKTLATWIRTQKNISYFQVINHSSIQDPDYLVRRRMHCNTELFASLIQKHLSPKTSSWISFWKESSMLIKQNLEEFFLKSNTLSEPHLIYALRHFSHFFLSNSMPIRDADLFLFAEEGTSFITANRGASGIDGNIATACGVAEALQKPLVAILGDLASLHDLNSLACVKKSKTPLLLFIINNGGGGIFSFLPIREKTDVFEELVATAHSYSFELLAKGFSLEFFSIDSLEELFLLQEDLLKRPRTCIIECKTDRSLNVLHHEIIYEKIKEAYALPCSLW